MDDSPKDPKTAGLPKRFNHETGVQNSVHHRPITTLNLILGLV